MEPNKKFTITCNECSSTDVDVSAEIGYTAPDCPYTVIVMICNQCGNKK